MKRLKTYFQTWRLLKEILLDTLMKCALLYDYSELVKWD